MSDEETSHETSKFTDSDGSTGAPVSPNQLEIANRPDLTENLALSLLKNPDLHPEAIERLAKNTNALKSRKTRIALVSHLRTPRHVSVPLARQLHTFDLMKVALAPGVPSDVKVAVDDILISRLAIVTLGERLTLARRASGRVAAALLLDLAAARKNSEVDVIQQRQAPRKSSAEGETLETRVMHTALDNPRLTEALVINSLLRTTANAALIQEVAVHEKWASRKEVRAALLRTEHLSLARALEFSREIPMAALQELLSNSRLPQRTKDLLLRQQRK